MWVPICQVGKWPGYYGPIEITRDLIDKWVAAFGPNEKIPVTRGHRPTDFDLKDTAAAPLAWVSGLMTAGDFLLANIVDWTSEGITALLGHEVKNCSIESPDGSKLTAVALLGAYDPAVEFHDDKGQRFVPLDMTGHLGEAGRILLVQALSQISLPYKEPPSKIKDVFADEEGPLLWIKIFNDAYEEYNGDEAKANATAWAKVKEAGYAKGEDGLWRKTKKAAQAAEGEKMSSFRQRLLAWLTEQSDEGADKPAGEKVPEIATGKAAQDAVPAVDSVALAARIDELEKALVKQKEEAQEAKAKAEAIAFCKQANLPPAFEVPFIDYFAGKDVVRLDAEGKKTAPRVTFLTKAFSDRGTKKFTDPIALMEAPEKTRVDVLDAKLDPDAAKARAREIAMASGQGYETVLRKILNLTSSGKSLEEAVSIISTALSKEQ